eukprot:3918987-Alexandrium_andersonii.AAC.1
MCIRDSSKGPEAVRATKLKGHAKAEHVAAGLLTDFQRVGNEWADAMATRGVELLGKQDGFWRVVDASVA